MRIRSIKPEFWSSEDISHLDWELAYVGNLPPTAAGWRAAAPQMFDAEYVYMLLLGECLVYVGKAATVLYRIERHRRRSWWHGVDYVIIVRVFGSDAWEATRNTLRFEKAAIAQLLPEQNIVGPSTLPARWAV